MKLCMIGTGYVGLVSGACFSDLGNEVICVDKNENKINKLKDGEIPFYEPGLEELVFKNYKNKRLIFSTDLKNSVKKSDIVFICVGTPSKKGGSAADLSQIFNVVKEISFSINNYKIIVTKSTVPVTTGDEIEKILSKKNTNSKTKSKTNSKTNLNSNKMDNLKSSSETISNTSNIDNINTNNVNNKISNPKKKTSYTKDEWDENSKNTWKLIDNYFEQCGKKQLIRHQIESYNDFVDNQIVDIIKIYIFN